MFKNNNTDTSFWLICLNIKLRLKGPFYVQQTLETTVYQSEQSCRNEHLMQNSTSCKSHYRPKTWTVCSNISDRVNLQMLTIHISNQYSTKSKQKVVRGGHRSDHLRPVCIVRKPVLAVAGSNSWSNICPVSRSRLLQRV